MEQVKYIYLYTLYIQTEEGEKRSKISPEADFYIPNIISASSLPVHFEYFDRDSSEWWGGGNYFS